MLEAAKDRAGIISFSDTESQGFSEFEKHGKMINPGPFYLVWTKYESRSIASYTDELKWPYQLKSIHLIK
ncbi:MAG: hypothetical protein H0V66_00410 [Bdellovibrionales bacterium]|nr:hypothetical protein [Bdellovibrionales bacterium]